MRFVIPLLASALLAHAVPAAPGEAAIEFLEKVRLNKVRLDPGGDTAISPQTGDAKKRQIARRLERTARDLGNDPLEIGTVKEDGEFAAVIVRKSGGFDPSRLQVFPVALVKKESGWTAAPVPASFENAGTGYSISLRERLEALENWMLRQQVLDLEKLREQAALVMRERIETRITAGELGKYDSEKTGLTFLSACTSRDLPLALGLLGGLGGRLPDDWPARLKAAERAMESGTDAVYPWRNLLAPEVLRVPVHHEEQGDKGLFSIACLDPAPDDEGSAKPRIHVLHLELSRSTEGLWQIDLPSAFLRESGKASEQADGDSDTDLVHRFATEWTRNHPPTPQPTPEMAQQILANTLREESPAKLLRLASLRTPPESASADCLGATHFWSPFHDKATFRHAIPLAMKSEETMAVGLFQIFSSRDTSLTDIRPVYFEKVPSGWLWTPLPSDAATGEFKQWVKSESAAWTGKWQEKLLARTAMLDQEILPAPEDQARDCVETWLSALREGDLDKALSLTARLRSARSADTTLRNTGYEILATRRNQQPAVLEHVYTGKSFSAVGTKVIREGKTTYPLHAVVQTASGPRVLIETDLVASGNRSRDYLNRDSLNQLQKASPAGVSEDLKALLGLYQSEIADGKVGSTSEGKPDSTR